MQSVHRRALFIRKRERDVTGKFLTRVASGIQSLERGKECGAERREYFFKAMTGASIPISMFRRSRVSKQLQKLREGFVLSRVKRQRRCWSLRSSFRSSPLTRNRKLGRRESRVMPQRLGMLVKYAKGETFSEPKNDCEEGLRTRKLPATSLKACANSGRQACVLCPTWAAAEASMPNATKSIRATNHRKGLPPEASPSLGVQP